jgi:diadenosine tetraphosphate (Ap4A) HIT family hydrolase
MVRVAAELGARSASPTTAIGSFKTGGVAGQTVYHLHLHLPEAARPLAAR